MPDALQCIASLGYVQKTAQKQPEIVLSAAMKTFEISKLENYLINFIRILWFLWHLGLVLFDNHKDVVSGKKFGFWQYFEFSRGKLGPKIDQNHQLWVRLGEGGGGCGALTPHTGLYPDCNQNFFLHTYYTISMFSFFFCKILQPPKINSGSAPDFSI